MLVTHAKIYTMQDSNIIEDGFILTKKKKIKSIGSMAECPENFNEHVLNLKNNACICPGFIDAHTHLGLLDNTEIDDINEMNDSCAPHLKTSDAVNPMDPYFKDALLAGITSAIVSPGSASPISGQILAMKTYGKILDEMIIKDPVGIKFSLGENQKRNYNKKNQVPSSRMSTVAIIRKQLNKAKRYMEDGDFALSSDMDSFESPSFDIKCESLVPLLEREIQAHIHAHSLHDIFTAVRIAKEFNIQCVIVHGTEAYFSAEKLEKDNIKILSGPILISKTKEELKNLNPKSTKILINSNVETAVITDHPEVPINYLPLCAFIAMREGLELIEALKTITINPAKICGISHRVGSLEKEKDADFIIFSGNVINLLKKPDYIFCNGINVLEQ